MTSPVANRLSLDENRRDNADGAYVFAPGHDGGDPEVERLRAAYAKTQGEQSVRYSWFGEGHLFMMHDLERHVLAALRGAGCLSLSDRTILEVGCASGNWLRQLLKWGAQPENVYGTDLLAERIDIARWLSAPGVHFSTGNAASLPFADDSFDIVCQSTVFTSILDPELRQHVAEQLVRVVRPDGFIIWYDFHLNNPRNRDVRGVTKREILELFRGCRVQLKRVTLAPPLARAIAPYSWLACWAMARIPPLCTHYLGVIRK